MRRKLRKTETEKTRGTCLRDDGFPHDIRRWIITVARAHHRRRPRPGRDGRGREPGYPGPPAQIRTCALTHTAPTLGG